MPQPPTPDHLADPLDPSDWLAMSNRGYDARHFHHQGIQHTVFQRGAGPAVLVMHELPGLTLSNVALADRLVDAGFAVHLPLLYGRPLASVAWGTVQHGARLCISREFAGLRAGQSAPIADWLRALAADIVGMHGGLRIGALGLCVTGAFVIPLVLEPGVAAAVASQPAAPLGISPTADINVPDAQLIAAGACAQREGKPLMLQRFAVDRYCPAERVERIAQAFGAQAEVHTLNRPGEPWRWVPTPGPHAILTAEYDAHAHDPTDPAVQAMARVIDFFRRHL